MPQLSPPAKTEAMKENIISGELKPMMPTPLWRSRPTARRPRAAARDAAKYSSYVHEIHSPFLFTATAWFFVVEGKLVVFAES